VAELQVEPAGAQGSNTAMVITREVGGEQRRVFLKGYRRLRDGINPEMEIGRHLTERSGFDRIAPLAGAIQWHRGDDVTALASLQGYTPNQGDAWTWTLEYLERFISDGRPGPGEHERQEASDTAAAHGPFLMAIELLGSRTGAMHAGLLDGEDEAFTPGTLSPQALVQLGESLGGQLDTALQELGAARGQLDAPTGALADRVVQGRQALLDRIDGTISRIDVEVVTTRVHGDYHLGQVLIDDNDFVIIDFEGEPGRSLEERRAKTSPLKDLAGMLRSLDYAASSALMREQEFEAEAGENMRLVRELDAWRAACSNAFLRGWRAAAESADQTLWPGEAAEPLLDLYVLDKAVYELRYEISHRPNWVGVPLAGLARLLD